jgi:hypothetical protein
VPADGDVLHVDASSHPDLFWGWRRSARAPPIADMVRPMRSPEIFPPDDPSYHPTAIGRTLFIDTVDRCTAATIVDCLQRYDASMRVAQLRVLGDAMSHVPCEDAAFAHRHGRILVNVAAFYDGPDDRPSRESWTAAFASALDQGHEGAYVGFVGDEGEARVRAAYPGSIWNDSRP